MPPRTCAGRARPRSGACRDHVSDVVVELEAQLLGAAVDLVAVDAGCEGGLLELLPHRLRLEGLDPVGPDQPAGVDEAGELVAGEERLLELRVPLHVQVLRVREDRLDELLRVALLAEDRSAVLRVLVERGVDLVVEVVEEGGRAPEFLVLAEVAGVPADRRLDGERVPSQRLGLRVLREGLPRSLAGDLHGSEVGYPPPFGSPSERQDYVKMQHTVVTDALMEAFVIEGARPLSGSIRAAGNKNAALPIVAACLLTDEPVTLTNVPAITDVETMLDLAADLGADVERVGGGEVRITRREHLEVRARRGALQPHSRIHPLRGALLARHGQAVVPPPGGDVIGRRRLDTHIHALTRLGADVTQRRSTACAPTA